MGEQAEIPLPTLVDLQRWVSKIDEQITDLIDAVERLNEMLREHVLDEKENGEAT